MLHCISLKIVELYRPNSDWIRIEETERNSPWLDLGDPSLPCIRKMLYILYVLKEMMGGGKGGQFDWTQT